MGSSDKPRLSSPECYPKGFEVVSISVRPTVLVVEDVGWIRRSMKSTLEGLGYRVTEARDADAAVESARRDPPDLVVTEEKLPTLDALAESAKSGRGPLAGVPLTIVNPDEEEGTRYGDIIVLPAYERLESLLDGAPR